MHSPEEYGEPQPHLGNLYTDMSTAAKEQGGCETLRSALGTRALHT